MVRLLPQVTDAPTWFVDPLDGRGLHSFTLQLNFSTFRGIR